MRYSTVDLIKLVFYVIFLGAILSVYLIIFHPSLAAGNNMYLTNFEGVYSHKNFLGRSMSLGCIISIFYYRFNKKASILNFIVCVIALYFSKSGTSYVILGIMILLLLLLKYKKRINILLVTGIPTVLIVIGLTAGNSILSDSMGYMNKDLTFTGRTYIWKYAINQIKKQPLLGYGYKAFWPTKADESQYVYIKEIDNNITHAHDGFINTSAEIGLIGAGIMILMLIKFLYSNRMIGIGEYEKCFMVIYFYFFIFNNITETSFLNTNNLYWMMIVVFIIKESYKAKGGSIIDGSIGKGILNGAQ
jgi:O-antigen ligase